MRRGQSIALCRAEQRHWGSRGLQGVGRACEVRMPWCDGRILDLMVGENRSKCQKDAAAPRRQRFAEGFLALVFNPTCS